MYVYCREIKLTGQDWPDLMEEHLVVGNEVKGSKLGLCLFCLDMYFLKGKMYASPQ